MNSPADPELALHGGAAISRQIHDQIRHCIVTGLLRPGDQLPTVRAVAVGLAVNPSAVAQAYAALERESWLTTEEGSGAFVAARPSALLPEGRQAELEDLCQEFLAQAVLRGFSSADVARTIQALTQRRASP